MRIILEFLTLIIPDNRLMVFAADVTRKLKRTGGYVLYPRLLPDYTISNICNKLGNDRFIRPILVLFLVGSETAGAIPTFFSVFGESP